MIRGKPSVNVLVKDKYTGRSEGLFSLNKPLVLSFAGKDRNLNNDITKIESILQSKMNPLVLDLYNIAMLVYVWDLQTPRLGEKPRHLSVLISVSNKDRWTSVKLHLESSLHFLTGDTFDFHFVQGEPAKEDFVPKRKGKECVMLFSGGLDSLAGVKWAADRKLEPVLVSHPGMGLISDTQKSLATSLRKIVGEDLKWHQIRAAAEAGTGLTAKEYSQFSRSFLYLTLGALFSLGLGIQQEFIFENGVMALNIPLTQSRIYSNTRTAHPTFLSMYQKLLDSLFGHQVTVENPFSAMTKGEVVKLLDCRGFRDLVKTTISCLMLDA